MAVCTRVEKMKRYLDQHAGEIEAAVTGSVSFDFAEGVTAKVIRVDRLRDPATLDSVAKMD